MAEPPGQLTDFEKRIYKPNSQGVLELEQRWAVIFDSVDGQNVIIGYFRRSGGYSEMVNRKGGIEWSDEIGVEPSLISPIDILGPGIVVGLGRSIGIATGRIIIGRGLSAAAARAGGGRVSAAILAAFQRMVQVARSLFTKKAVEVVSGPLGSVARSTLEAAMKAGGSIIRVATKLTARPQAGRALSVAAGDNAVALANAARTAGQVYVAEIPKALVVQLEKIGLAKMETTLMGNVVGTEYRFLAAASEFIVPFFR